MSGLAVRTATRLLPDPSRVVALLFVPGHEHDRDGESRATGVLRRILALEPAAVRTALERVRERFAGRHRDLDGLLRAHAALLEHRIPEGASLDDDQRQLVGAYFTRECAVEAAALFNPSVVAHPDQGGVPEGGTRLLLTLRGVGEGHVSCVEFRTGVLGPGPQLVLDDPGPHAGTGSPRPTWHDRALFGALLAEAGADDESSRYLLGRLPERFDEPELAVALHDLEGQAVTRAGGARTAELARALARDAYEVDFAPDVPLAERVLWPQARSESSGIEDVRLVRYVDGEDVQYLGTCTAYDGRAIVAELISTTDFRSFRVVRLAGEAVRDKGLALFPRPVGGRRLALSRSGHEQLGISASPDGLRWETPVPLDLVAEPWELLQGGNCGSPLETAAGWLVLTHGVGPLREYGIGALLLDLHDPTRVVGRLRAPLLTAEGDEREGYVPNVVYSCGALAVGDLLLLPYGTSDRAVGFALVALPALLEALTSPATTAANTAS